MKLTRDEERALAFVAALVLLSAAVRLAALPEPVEPPGGGFDLDAHIAATERAVEEAERRERPLAPGETVDPNTAPADALDRLPGVGPALARRIVEDRTENGRYRAVPDLVRVPGIGPKTLDRLAPHLALPPGPAREDGARSGRGDAAASGAVRARTRPSGSDASSRSTRSRGSLSVDVNTATAAELTGLPGVGPVIAARIVAYRDSAGPFARVDDLVRVRGIGPATLERIRPRARVR